MNTADLGGFSVGASSYIGVMALLAANSIGLPIPDEIILVLAGAAVYQGKMDLWLLMGLASAAILLGDFVIFSLGRLWGPSLLKRRIFKTLLPPKRVEKFKERYAEHIYRGVFTVRFISGLRAPAYFTAGTLRLAPHKFVLTDLAAALVHVPVFTMLGFLSSAHIGRVVSLLHEVDRWMAVAIVLAVLLSAAYIGYRIGLRRKRKEDDKPL